MAVILVGIIIVAIETSVVFALVTLFARLFGWSARFRNRAFLIASYPGVGYAGAGWAAIAVPLPTLVGAPMFAYLTALESNSYRAQGWLPAPGLFVDGLVGGARAEPLFGFLAFEALALAVWGLISIAFVGACREAVPPVAPTI